MSTTHYTPRQHIDDSPGSRRNNIPTTITHRYAEYAYTVDGEEYHKEFGFGMKEPPEEITLYYMRNPKRTFLLENITMPWAMFMLMFGPVLVGYAVVNWIEFLRTGSFY